MKNAIATVPMLLLSLGACRGDPPATSPADLPLVANTSAGATASDAVTPAVTAAPSATPPIADTPAPAPAVAPLSDDAILQVTHTANLGEIEQATLALAKARDSRVKQLATMMLKEHTAADAKGMTLVKSAHLNPLKSEVSTSLESDAQAATSALKSQSAGADFDKAYVDTQVKEHQAVLDTIDQKLIPAANNADLRSYLGDVRPKIAKHLEHALELQKQMAKGTHTP
jgi:putative membrane protein